jgi:hypothetical protein
MADQIPSSAEINAIAGRIQDYGNANTEGNPTSNVSFEDQKKTLIDLKRQYTLYIFNTYFEFVQPRNATNPGVQRAKAALQKNPGDSELGAATNDDAALANYPNLDRIFDFNTTDWKNVIMGVDTGKLVMPWAKEGSTGTKGNMLMAASQTLAIINDRLIAVNRSIAGRAKAETFTGGTGELYNSLIGALKARDSTLLKQAINRIDTAQAWSQLAAYGQSTGQFERDINEIRQSIEGAE